jgi:uncharacterized protein YbgA (DUF1722 family)
MDMGMGTPRKTLRLEEGSLIDTDGRDWGEIATVQLKSYLSKIDWMNVHGMILMKKSPSCGLERVKQFKKNARQSHEMGQGFFAKEIRKSFPPIPFLDSGRLESEYCRNNFLIQLFSYFRFCQLDRTPKSLQEFHRDHKYLLMDKSPESLKMLGRMVAQSGIHDLEEVFACYGRLFIETLRRADLGKRKLNTLYHLMGYLKKELPSHDKKFLLQMFEQCRTNDTRIVELERLIHFLVNKFNVSYLIEQYYFEPYPEKLRA